MKIKNAIVFLYILMLLLAGCSSANEHRSSDYTIAKRIAIENLSTEDRATILPWTRESAAPIPIHKIPGYISTDELPSQARLYKVQFYTSKDERVGPIGIYVDVVSGTVIGHQLRN